MQPTGNIVEGIRRRSGAYSLRTYLSNVRIASRICVKRVLWTESGLDISE